MPLRSNGVAQQSRAYDVALWVLKSFEDLHYITLYYISGSQQIQCCDPLMTLQKFPRSPAIELIGSL